MSENALNKEIRVLILGGTGMLGHKLWQTCAPRFDTYATVRRPFRLAGVFDESHLIDGVVAEEFDSVTRAFARVRPDVVVNCIGIVKQDAAAKDAVTSITINSVFPHRLAQLCDTVGARLIHLSTDCVFSGNSGNYSEIDVTDAQDLYGRTKALGELHNGNVENCLTLRTSMIGRELHGAHGLIEWFMAQRGKTVRGFKRAVFSGFTTQALASVIADLIHQHPELKGTWHVAADPINKFELLQLVRGIYELDIEVDPDESFVCDRSLNGARFREKTGIVAQPWPEMIKRMKADDTPYDEIRRINASR